MGFGRAVEGVLNKDGLSALAHPAKYTTVSKLATLYSVLYKWFILHTHIS